MAEPPSRRVKLFRARSQWAALAVTVCLGAAMFAFVDLSPRIDADFFFSSDDPQLQDSRRIDTEFGQAPQVFIAARSERVVSAQYLRRLHALTEDLRSVSGVADVRSVTRGPKDPEDVLDDDPREVFEDLDDGPFWRRLLVAPDRSATFIVLRLADDTGQATIEAIDAVLAAHGQSDFVLGATGVPYVSEHIRARLSSDLRRFSVAAILAFGILIGLLFRSLAVLTGTMVAALAASFGTFLVRAALGMESDILMPNLWTIAFVLTLSHVVYLTAAWQHESRRSQDHRAVGNALRLTSSASAWSLAANLLGFASLMLVSAKPLRQFGLSGAIAAALAIAAAYVLFPPFLRAARAPSTAADSTSGFASFVQRPHPWIAASVVTAAIVLAPLAWRVDTDPSLPTYFGQNDPIRTGLESVDLAGGSSPLEFVVADKGNRPFDQGEMVDRLQALERAIERHPDVGVVLSIASLMGEAERPWYAFLFSWETRLDQLDSPRAARVGRTFLSEDRRRARFILRMRENARTRPRADVIGDITATIEKHGFQPVVVGGLYPLQGELSRLVEGSVVRGLGGLLAAFFVIVWFVTRAWRTALVMTLCLATTPLLLFGIVTLGRMPLDIISAPAANVALPLGIDEMIHLGFAVRRRRQAADGKEAAAWRDALVDLWRPILFSMIVVASGFALFLLSSFPPTQRLGMLVCLGAILTDLVVLLVLPTMAAPRRRVA